MFRLTEREMATAFRLDPVSLIQQTDWARVALFARNYEQAAARFAKVLETDPHFVRALDTLVCMNIVRGAFGQAKEGVARLLLLYPDRSSTNPVYDVLIGAGAGRLQDTERSLTVLEGPRSVAKIDVMVLAHLLAWSGHKARAIDLVEKVYRNHEQPGVIG